MILKTIKITPLAVAFGICIVATNTYAAQTQGFLTIKSTEIEVKSTAGSKTLDLEIKTAAPIPLDGKSGAFGYAALSDGGNNLLVLVTHLPIDDSSYENPVNGFHAHVLDLTEPGAACAGANFEVDLENSGKNKAFDADYKWQAKGNEISVKNVPVADLGDAGVESVVSFTLKPVLDANKKPAHLCVTVTHQN
ncbi:MAG: hypothetical protein CVV13_06120 [Gammaproteobacteria bacterium HGW-Gammaproteobacteria-3]|nr:MAG: hypothetical protein CVV13_06120 [Gammaproteobacteria bacterium HGW-Gammaproteobacteria-3]